MTDIPQYHGLKETPNWRWALYTIAYIGVLLFISHALNDRGIFWGGLIGGAIVTSCFLGMNALLSKPEGRAFVLRNLGILLAIYVLGTVALFIWDLFTKK